ncbi:MAG: DUF2110 family protein [Candidatus Bathyarchaeota archaeon]|nr:DUF2110 family protein [Candidatus Bathyarchaeota archaeon]
MITLTLLVKASHTGQLRQVEEMLKNQFEDLEVEVRVLGSLPGRWVQVSLLGEDEGVATSYIKKEIGTCPISIEDALATADLRGYISKVDGAKQELMVDVGVFEPKVTQATIPVHTLQMQLTNGREVTLQKIASSYALCEGVPLNVKLIADKGEIKEGVLAELSAVHVEKMFRWRDSLLDRLIVLGASEDFVKTVLERTRLTRDVIDVETLGLFEHALTCKLGTDAAGLIPRIGRYMRNSAFVVFSAAKNIGFCGE